MKRTTWHNHAAVSQLSFFGHTRRVRAPHTAFAFAIHMAYVVRPTYVTPGTGTAHTAVFGSPVAVPAVGGGAAVHYVGATDLNGYYINEPYVGPISVLLGVCFLGFLCPLVFLCPVRRSRARRDATRRGAGACVRRVGARR